jgi:hypothetical protein
MRKHAWLSSMRSWFNLSVALFVAALICLPSNVQAVGSMELIGLTNSQRSNNGLPPLSYNGRLAASAYAKAQHMLANDYWAHTAPDGTTPWVFVQQAGYAYITVGENLARGFQSDSAIVSSWMNSPGHRANLLNTAYRDMGVAAVTGTMNGEVTTLVVAHFGATASAPVAARPAATPQPSAPARTTTTQSPKAKEVVVAAPKPKATAAVKAASVPAKENRLAVLLKQLSELAKPEPADFMEA